MTKITCDHCGKEIKEDFRDYRGDLDDGSLSIIEIKPISLNQTTSVIANPDLCRECIIETLRG